RELEHESATLAVLGDVTNADVEHLARRRVLAKAAGDPYGPVVRSTQACDRVDQLRLSVAVDAGDADDLARPHRERDAADLLDPSLVDDLQVLDLEEHFTGLRRGFLDPQQYLAADHRLRERGLRGAGSRDRLDRLPAPKHRDPVGDL